MKTTSLWRLEFSELQQCFHQDCYPTRHQPNTNSYFTLLENAKSSQCQDFIRFVRDHQGEYISKNEILSWREQFVILNS
jgi:hypothetical protein